MLQVIAAAIDWTFPGRSEMVRGALDTLAICSALPRVQLSFCEKIKLFDDNTAVGMSVILSAAEGDIVQVSDLLVLLIGPSRGIRVSCQRDYAENSISPRKSIVRENDSLSQDGAHTCALNFGWSISPVSYVESILRSHPTFAAIKSPINCYS